MSFLGTANLAYLNEAIKPSGMSPDFTSVFESDTSGNSFDQVVTVTELTTKEDETYPVCRLTVTGGPFPRFIEVFLALAFKS